MDTVSVIIPTYNCSDRLMRALCSVADQTFPLDHIEVIVVDDGSTDDTSARVSEFSAQIDMHVRYVRQNNAGPAAARNHGIRLAKGSVIAFLDDDDLWLPTKLERQVPLLQGSTGLAYCDNVFVDSYGIVLENYVRRIRLCRGNAMLALFQDFFLLTSAVCLRKSVIDEIGGFKEHLRVGEDYEFFLRVAAKCDFDYSSEKLLVRTVRPDSLSRQDFCLDAESDLSTLNEFLSAHPNFASANRVAVRKRLADYRFEYGYNLLSHGKRHQALRQLTRSMWSWPSVATIKTCARLFLPSVRGSSGGEVGK